MIPGPLAALGSQPHDPGGKVRTLMPEGMSGGASFCGPDDCYRTELWRLWSEADAGSPYALWIGMNPSTGDADLNDPTISREVGFTKRLGLSSYVKCNVMDYRATNPSRLLGAGVLPRSAQNLSVVTDRALKAYKVIVAFGTLPPRLLVHAHVVFSALESHDIEMWCLGKTKHGWPRHPLYLRSDTEFEEWEWPA